MVEKFRDFSPKSAVRYGITKLVNIAMIIAPSPAGEIETTNWSEVAGRSCRKFSGSSAKDTAAAAVTTPTEVACTRHVRLLALCFVLPPSLTWIDGVRIVQKFIRVPSAYITRSEVPSGHDQLADLSLRDQSHILVHEINYAVVDRFTCDGDT